MDGADGWSRGRWVAGLVLLAVLGYYPFVRGVRVPLLGWIDLAVHEAGHLFALPLPGIGTAIMGNGFQVLVPLVLAVAFEVVQHDRLGAAVCLGWTGAALRDASVYIADAPYQRLPLIGGRHDWAYVLGPAGVGRLDLADDVARLVLVAAVLAWAGGVLVCVVTLAVPSARADTRLPAAASRRPAGDAGPAAGRAVRPHDPDLPDRDAAGRVDPGGGGDAPRPRVVW